MNLVMDLVTCRRTQRIESTLSLTGRKAVGLVELRFSKLKSCSNTNNITKTSGLSLTGGIYDK